MQNLKLLVVVAVCISFNVIDACEQAQKDRNAIKIAALEAIQRHDQMIEMYNWRSHALGATIIAGTIMTVIMLPILYKETNADVCNEALKYTAIGSTISIGTAGLMYADYKITQYQENHATKQLTIHAIKLGVLPETIEQIYQEKDSIKGIENEILKHINSK